MFRVLLRVIVDTAIIASVLFVAAGSLTTTGVGPRQRAVRRQMLAPSRYSASILPSFVSAPPC